MIFTEKSHPEVILKKSKTIMMWFMCKIYKDRYKFCSDTNVPGMLVLSGNESIIDMLVTFLL